MNQKQADLTNVGIGEYMDVSVTIRVIDNRLDRQENRNTTEN